MKSWKGKKRLSLRSKAIMILCFFLCFIFLSLIYLANVVNPVIYQAAEAQVKSSAQKALSSAVYSIVSSSPDSYSDIINYTYNDNGAISLIKVNSYYVNILSRKITALAQGSIDNMTSSGINVHLGAFSGITIFVNLGPKVTMNLNSIGTVITIFRSEFLSSGINQTNHRIYVNIKSSVCIVLPIYSPVIETETEILIGETIIIGEIPETYLQFLILMKCLT